MGLLGMDAMLNTETTRKPSGASLMAFCLSMSTTSQGYASGLMRIPNQHFGTEWE